MKLVRLVSLAVLSALLVGEAPSRAAEAHLSHAKIQSHSGALSDVFPKLVSNASSPAWIGYSVEMVPGDQRICCYDSNDSHEPAVLRHGRCYLEGHNDGMNFNTDNDSAVAGRRLLVMYRVSDQHIDKVRVFSEDCELDAGGLTVHWIDDAKASESLALLEPLVARQTGSTQNRRHTSGEAIAAIALHADTAADKVLDHLVDPAGPLETRKDAAFWMGSVRGRAGFERVRRLAREDSDDKLREHCMFVLNICKDPDAIGELIDIARHDKSAHVRGQGLFWLSQKAGEKAAAAIGDAVENDPDTEVKKKAVFALSQLPAEQGVPKLIEAARNSHNRTVRKESMFWLGQSNSPKALAFFEEVLTH